MDINKESIRKEFEATLGPEIDTSIRLRFPDGTYRRPAVESAWKGYLAAAAPRDELLRETYEFMSNGSAGSYEAGLRWDKFLSRLRERGYSD